VVHRLAERQDAIARTGKRDPLVPVGSTGAESRQRRVFLYCKWLTINRFQFGISLLAGLKLKRHRTLGQNSYHVTTEVAAGFE
jgi:hypothetical protein